MESESDLLRKELDSLHSECSALDFWASRMRDRDWGKELWVTAQEVSSLLGEGDTIIAVRAGRGSVVEIPDPYDNGGEFDKGRVRRVLGGIVGDGIFFVRMDF